MEATDTDHLFGRHRLVEVEALHALTFEGAQELGLGKILDAFGNAESFEKIFAEHGNDVVLAADVYGDDRSRPWVSAGAGWALLSTLSFNAAYAVKFESRRIKQVSVGMKIVF